MTEASKWSKYQAPPPSNSWAPQPLFPISCLVSSLLCCPAHCLFSGLTPCTEIPGQPFCCALFHSSSRSSSSEVPSGLMPPCSPFYLSTSVTCSQTHASETFIPVPILPVPHLVPHTVSLSLPPGLLSPSPSQDPSHIFFLCLPGSALLLRMVTSRACSSHKPVLSRTHGEQPTEQGCSMTSADKLLQDFRC